MRGNITRRGKSSWQLKFDVGTIDGKRHTRYATVRGTYKDAQRKLTELLNAADTGTLPDPCDVTLAEYLRTWLKSAHEQSPKTLERYGELAERQIIPHLGAIKLQKLKPEHVQAWHSELLNAGLTPRTVGHAHRLLRLVLQCAVKNGTLTRNVATVHRPPKVEEAEIEILSPEQIADVLAKPKATRCCLSCRLLLPLGCVAANCSRCNGAMSTSTAPRCASNAALRKRRRVYASSRPRQNADGAISPCPRKLFPRSGSTRCSS